LITKNENKIQLFTSFEPSLGHRFQALGNKTNKKQLEV
jgi:hypothetical protein